MLRGVFNAYLANPSLLGRNTVRRVRREGLERSVCDYLSGMTDGYLLDEFARVCAPAPPPAPPSSRDRRLEIAD
jgi:dGTPase